MAAPKQNDRADVIESINPATKEILGTVPIQTKEQVSAAVVRARYASETWGNLSFRERNRQLTEWRRLLARHADELADLIHRENGKPRTDAMSEVLTSLMHLAHGTARAEKVLRTRKVSTGYMPNFRAEVAHRPLGVIGVIGPWNYPLFTPMGSIAYALAAGNAVVFKPSEFTPLVGQRLGELADEAFSIPSLLEVVTGDGSTGGALATSEVDKIAFTGSEATGKRVMAAAAESLTPVVLELGGKDPMIVTEDANLAEAAQAAVFGALSNAGQACVSIERCYVVESVYQEFVDLVVKEARQVTWGEGADADIGPITRPAQVDVIREHLSDAAARGATTLVGGVDQIRDNWVPPTVVVDVTHEMKIMSEETFGPVLPILRVSSAEEALEMANNNGYGLASSVFGGARARKIAARLRTGSTAVNAVLAFAAIPGLPFGGVGASGFGRIHGDAGLFEFTRPHSTCEKRFSLPKNMLAFGTPTAQVKALVENLFGGGAVDRAGEVIRRVLR